MKLERMIAIIMLLLERDQISGKQLAEMFEVSLRTIYRDIVTINQAGIPIATAPGINGGISILKQYKVSKGFFTPKDIAAMLMGLGFISSTLSGESITHTLAKIKSFIPANQLNEITLKTSQISFDLSRWIGNRDSLQPKLELIRAALEHRRTISVLYSNRQKEKSCRILEPHRLLLKENHWYLQAYCATRQEFRLFKLSRMSQIELQTQTFAIRESPPAFSEFVHSMTKKTIRVKLRVDSSILDQVLDYCSEKDIEPIGANQYLVQFPFIEDDYGYAILLGWADKCLCLEPKHIRNEIIKRLQTMLAEYQFLN